MLAQHPLPIVDDEPITTDAELVETLERIQADLARCFAANNLLAGYRTHYAQMDLTTAERAVDSAIRDIQDGRQPS